MTSSPSGTATGHKDLGGLDFRPHVSRPLRWLGAIVAVALFAADTLQPVIGLVEVTSGAKTRSRPTQAADRDSERADERAFPSVVWLQAWQWQESCGELWPTFVFQPTINAGSGGSARSETTGCTSPALPPVASPWRLSGMAAIHLPSTPIDGAAFLRVQWYREIPPVGPPVA